MPKTHRLRDAYRHPGFVPAMTVRVDDDAPDVFVLPLHRRQKKRSAAPVFIPPEGLTTTSFASRAISIAAGMPSISNSNFAASIVPGAV